MTPTRSNARSRSRRWTDADVARLHQLAREKLSPWVISLQLGRTEAAIRRKAQAEGIALEENAPERIPPQRWRRSQ